MHIKQLMSCMWVQQCPKPKEIQTKQASVLEAGEREMFFKPLNQFSKLLQITLLLIY